MKLPVETSSTEETGAHGCAIAAAIAVGDQPDISTALNTMTAISAPVLPQDKYYEIYDRKYSLYKKVIESLTPVWDEYQEI